MLAAIVGVIVLLTGGWPLVNAAVGDLGDSEAVPAGGTLRIGSGDRAAWFTVGPGWFARPSASDLRQGYLLVRGAVRLSVISVMPHRPATSEQLWEGLSRIVRVGDTAARLGGPRRIGGSGHPAGLTGSLVQGGRVGTATVLPAPRNRYAVAALILGPRSPRGEQDRRAARDAIESIRFAGEP